jgi:hypothetical protein
VDVVDELGEGEDPRLVFVRVVHDCRSE